MRESVREGEKNLNANARLAPMSSFRVVPSTHWRGLAFWFYFISIFIFGVRKEIGCVLKKAIKGGENLFCPHSPWARERERERVRVCVCVFV